MHNKLDTLITLNTGETEVQPEANPEFNVALTTETLPESLLLMAKGMVGIFVVIAVIMGVVALLNRLFKGKKKTA